MHLSSVIFWTLVVISIGSIYAISFAIASLTSSGTNDSKFVGQAVGGMAVVITMLEGSLLWVYATWQLIGVPSLLKVVIVIATIVAVFAGSLRGDKNVVEEAHFRRWGKDMKQQT